MRTIGGESVLIRDELESILQGINQPEPVPERLGLQEAAEYLGVSKSYIYKLTHTLSIPYYKFSKRLIFYMKELEDWIK